MSVTTTNILEGVVEQPIIQTRNFITFDAAIDFAKLIVPEELRLRKVQGGFQLQYMGSEGML